MPLTEVEAVAILPAFTMQSIGYSLVATSLGGFYVLVLYALPARIRALPRDADEHVSGWAYLCC